jgi:methionyl-tRNA formyltransferase
LIIWRSLPEPIAETEAKPGEVVAARGDQLIVSCGERTQLRLLEVQPQAKRRMSARDFLNGTRLQVGETFG